MAQGDSIDPVALWAADLPAVSPLFPLTSRAVRRCVLAAERLGLVCVPYLVNVGVPSTYWGTSEATLSWTTAQSMGPVCIVHMDLPEDHPSALIVPKVAGTAFTDGTVVQADAFDIPREYNGTMMESPIPVPSTYQVSVEMQDTGLDYDDGDGATFYTLGVLARSRATKTLCAAPTDLTALWLDNVAKDGVWWGTTVRSRPSNKPFVKGPITAPSVIETLVLAEKRAVVEGEGNSLSTVLRLSQQQTALVTPFGGALYGRRASNGQRALVQSGLRWSVPASTDIELEVRYATATATEVPVRVTLLGRRYGIVTTCMDQGLLV